MPNFRNFSTADNDVQEYIVKGTEKGCMQLQIPDTWTHLGESISWDESFTHFQEIYTFHVTLLTQGVELWCLEVIKVMQ